MLFLLVRCHISTNALSGTISFIQEYSRETTSELKRKHKPGASGPRQLHYLKVHSSTIIVVLECENLYPNRRLKI